MSKKNLVSLAFVFLTVTTFAQTTVSLVVSGEGPTKTEATSAALRSAIEQAFGTFVSANTTILNDELVENEIATVSSGNIESYDEISSFESNGKWEVTLNASVSIDKLVNYVKGKGAETEFAGQTFALQMKMRALNKENEKQALLNLVKQVRLLTSNNSLFDYDIVQSEPKYVDGDKYRIHIVVRATKNENYFIIRNLITNTFKSLALTDTESTAYSANNYPTNCCRPFEFEGWRSASEAYCMRSEEEFLSAIEQELSKNITLNVQYFQVERMGGGDSYKTFYMQYSKCHYIIEEYSLSTEIPQDVLYNTSGFKVVPKLPLREVEYVDLGLSVKWASCNLGAFIPFDYYGGHYQWAGTKDVSDTDIYHYYKNGPYHTGSDRDSGWTKYNTDESYGTVDNKTVLESMDDAASVALGGKWRMPTDAEWSELMNTENCSWTWTTIDGVNGYKVQSKKPGYTDNWIFLPAAGRRLYGGLFDVKSDGYYWSSSLDTAHPNGAYLMCFNSGDFHRNYYGYRYCGFSVRPVSE